MYVVFVHPRLSQHLFVVGVLVFACLINAIFEAQARISRILANVLISAGQPTRA